VADLTHAEAERAVLGAVLIDGTLLQGEPGTLAPDDFSDPRNRRIYVAMVSTAKDGQPIDIRTVQAALEQRGELDPSGGLVYLAGLDVDLPELGRIDAYVRIVREASIRRRLSDALRATAQRLSEGAVPLGEVLSEANAELRKADERIAVERLSPIGECLDDVLRALNRPFTSSLPGITTGYPELDRMTLGWQGGQLVVVAGRPGQGKTALACCMARAAVDAGAPAIFFSLEMGRDELAARFACAETGVAYNAIRSGHLSTAKRAIVERAVEDFARLPLYLVDSPHLTPARLGALIRRAKRQAGVRLAIVDYLGLLAGDEHGRYETRNIEVAALSRALKLLAKDLAIPILAVHQLNRAPEKRSDPRPVLSDLRDSGAIEQDADIVVLLYQDPDHEKREAELIVAKQRNGMTGPVRVRSVMEAFRFDPWNDSPAQTGIAFGGG
jgi:replicative DNA helicase